MKVVPPQGEILCFLGHLHMRLYASSTRVGQSNLLGQPAQPTSTQGFVYRNLAKVWVLDVDASILFLHKKSSLLICT
jgi:hypothetical protein